MVTLEPVYYEMSSRLRQTKGQVQAGIRRSEIFWFSTAKVLQRREPPRNAMERISQRVMATGLQLEG